MNSNIPTIKLQSQEEILSNANSSPKLSPLSSPLRREKSRRKPLKNLNLKRAGPNNSPDNIKSENNVNGYSPTLKIQPARKFTLEDSMIESEKSDADENKDLMDIKIEDLPDVQPMTLNLVLNESHSLVVGDSELKHSFSKEDMKIEGVELTEEQYQRRMIRRPSLRKRILANEFSNEELVLIASYILRLEYNLRRKEDKENLVDCMRASVAFFANYDRDTVNRCMKYMNHTTRKNKDVIFEVGTIGTNFWVLLKGSVVVRIPIKQPTGQVDAKGEPIMQEVMTDARILPAGSGFGELALMNNKPRAATIVCNEDCEFAVLEKEPFNAILKEKETAKLFSEIDFLVSLPMLKGWSFSQVRKFFYVAPIMRYQRGTVLFNQGDEMLKVYIVKAGEFKITKVVTINKEGLEDVKDPMSTMFRKNLTKANVELGLLGEKELIGEMELVTVSNKRDFQVVCNSLDAYVYEITKKDFKDYIMKVDSSRIWLNNYIKNKQRFYYERLKTITQNRHTPSVYHNAKKIVEMVHTEEHEDLKDSFNQIVKHGLSVKRMKRFVRKDIPLLSEDAERELSPAKLPENGIRFPIKTEATLPDLSPQKLTLSPMKNEITPPKKSISPLRATVQSNTAEKQPEKPYINIESERPTTRGGNKTSSSLEKTGPVKFSIFKNSQEEEKKKMAERRINFQKKLALSKNKSEKYIATEPTERERLNYSQTHVNLKTEMYPSIQRAESRGRIPTTENYTANFNHHIPGSIASVIMSSQNKDNFERQANDSYDFSLSKISLTQPISNIYEKIQHNKQMNRNLREPSPIIKRDKKDDVETFRKPTFSKNISRTNREDLENRLKKTLANLHPQSTFTLNEDIGLRTRQPIRSGPTLYNSTILKPVDPKPESGAVSHQSSSSNNLHVLRMKEIEDLKANNYKAINSRTQRMRLIELVGSYYNEKGAHIIFDFHENTERNRAVTATPIHKRHVIRNSESKINLNQSHLNKSVKRRNKSKDTN